MNMITVLSMYNSFSFYQFPFSSRTVGSQQIWIKKIHLMSGRYGLSAGQAEYLPSGNAFMVQ